MARTIKPVHMFLDGLNHLVDPINITARQRGYGVRVIPLLDVFHLQCPPLIFCHRNCQLEQGQNWLNQQNKAGDTRQ